jgi:hypothetical protein
MSACYLVTILLITFISCKSTIQSNKNRIKPPVAARDIPFQTFEFNADSGIVIHTETGTFIAIEAGSLADSSGKPVNGKVELKFREFHDAQSIYAAGIPMDLDAKNYLKSAGMLEIRAFQGDNQLGFQKGKSAQVQLASYQNPSGYRLYFFEGDNQWQVTDSFQTVNNKKKYDGLTNLNGNNSAEQEEFAYFEFATNLEDAEYLKPYKKIEWRIKKADIDQVFLDAMRINWDEVKVVPAAQKGEEYTLIFSLEWQTEDDKKILRTFTCYATPVKSGTRKVIGDMHTRDAESAALYRKMEEDKIMFQKQADLLNSFRISRMGIWNVDILMKIDNGIKKSVQFDFQKDLKIDQENLQFFLLFKRNNAVMSYEKKTWKEVVFDPKDEMTIMIVLPGGQTVQVDADQISQKIKSNDKVINFTTMVVQ